MKIGETSSIAPPDEPSTAHFVLRGVISRPSLADSETDEGEGMEEGRLTTLHFQGTRFPAPLRDGRALEPVLTKRQRLVAMQCERAGEFLTD